jgi:hypothetical protein
LKEHAMTKNILAVAIATLCAVALTAGPARAGSTLAVSLVPNFALPVSCSDDALFGFGLDVNSLSGRPVGTGQTCITTSDGCDPFTAFCRRTVRSTLTLNLARGSLTVPLKLLEVLPTESSFLQLGSGDVAAGTGIYAAARGRVTGGGGGSFDDQGTFTGRLVYTAHLAGVR